MKNKIKNLAKSVKLKKRKKPSLDRLSQLLERKNKLFVFIAIFAVAGTYLLIRSLAATGNDLIVTNVAMSPADPSAGQAVTFSATIKNQGTTVTPSGEVVGITFYVDGQKVTWNLSNTSSLAAGASVTLTANDGTSGSAWSATTGPHTLTAVADDDNIITNEINESNNSRNLSFTVGSTGTLYISPASTDVFINNNVTVDVRINPDTNIDGVQTTINYDASKLQFASINFTGSPFDIELLTQTGTSGTIKVERGTLSGSVSSDSLIAKITFKALVGSGSGLLDLSGNATNAGFYTNPATTDGTINFKTPDTTAPSVSLVSPFGGENIWATYNVTANAFDDVGVAKVEFYIDGQLKHTDTTSPYGFSLDTTTLSNGSHTFQAKAYDAAGNVGSSGLVSATVKNWPEDINQDGVVNLLDFSLLASKYGQTGNDLGREDINNDGAVNLLDFSLLAAKYGQ